MWWEPHWRDSQGHSIAVFFITILQVTSDKQMNKTIKYMATSFAFNALFFFHCNSYSAIYRSKRMMEKFKQKQKLNHPQNFKPTHVIIISKFNGNDQPLRREAEASATACAHTLSRALTSLGSSPDEWNNNHVNQSVITISYIVKKKNTY